MKRPGALVVGVALAVRLAVVAWAHGRVPPVADGHYYHRLATRIAEGEGYSWLWPDGAVTAAAHYPVGYPGLIAGPYAVFGASPTVAMIANALLGAAGCWAVHRLVALGGGPKLALWAGLIAAIHPGTVFYTPALMTEGITGALLAIAACCAASARANKSTAMMAFSAAMLGLATLVRPQSLLFAPLVGFFAVEGARRRVLAGALSLAVALLVCLPWTVRNCLRMDRCALVSMNGGWNLLIGTKDGDGGWTPLEVPASCRTVWDEAEKDSCFAKEAKARILADPAAHLARAPAKIAATFDHGGAPGWYLHSANPSAFGARAKLALGTVELVFDRLVLILALVAAFASKRASRAGALVLAAGLIAALSQHASIAYLAFAALVAMRARHQPALVASAIVVIGTAAVHAFFFGGARYQLVVYPLLCGAAALGLERLWVLLEGRRAASRNPDARGAATLAGDRSGNEARS